MGDTVHEKGDPVPNVEKPSNMAVWKAADQSQPSPLAYRRTPRISALHRLICFTRTFRWAYTRTWADMRAWAYTPTPKLCYWKVSRKWEVHCWKPLCKPKTTDDCAEMYKKSYTYYPRVWLCTLGTTVNFANNDCGYNDNSRITTEFSCPEQGPIQLWHI